MNKQLNNVNLLVTASSLLSLGIFTATYFAYFNIVNSGHTGSYIPLTIGGIAFISTMTVIVYMASQQQTLRTRLAEAIGVSLIISFVALFIFMFLVLNTLGS